MVRPSNESDIEAISAIYAHYVRHSTATFETEPPDPIEMGRRRANIQLCNLPYIVAEANGLVVGYAYATPYRPRNAYRFTVEDSIYIHPEHLGKGVGKALLASLIDACKHGGARQMIAIIGGSDNAASIRLHESFKFNHAGTLKSVEFKFEQWLDTVLMQRAL